MKTIPFWGAVNFQNNINEWMCDIDWFHTYCILFLFPIIVIVLMSVYFLMMSSKFLNSYIWEHPTLEGVWTFIPAQFLFILAIPSIELLYLSEIPEDENPSLTIKIIGHQWYWSYEYIKENEEFFFDSYMIPVTDLVEGDFRLLEVDSWLMIPLYSLTRFVITSMDVIHSFALPSAGLKVDAIPGRLNQIFGSFDFPGVYYGQCSEICGANHSFMPIMLQVY